jgi:hypothetical protein
VYIGMAKTVYTSIVNNLLHDIFHTLYFGTLRVARTHRSHNISEQMRT